MTQLPVFLALDGLSLEDSCSLSMKVGKRVTGSKIHNLYDLHGTRAVGALQECETIEVFVDMKLYDIPETVGLRAKAIKESGAAYLTVHATGGIDMMRKAVENGPKILAVTELTSFEPEDIELHSGLSSKASVLNLARWAALANVYGLVCSPQEVTMLRKRRELDVLKLVVPGVRSPGVDVNDQKRVGTPYQAIFDGADYLVIGREVTKAQDPFAALENIGDQIAKAIADKAKAEEKKS